MAAEEVNKQGVEVLSFKLGAEEYGLDILKVQEIRGYESVTRIANVPEYVKGVVNLRGIIVPIIDMRIQFNLDAPTYNELTVVIILNLGNRVIGMVVDSVSDVVSLTPEQIKPAPTMATAVNTDYVTGIGTVDERMLILVDIQKLLAAQDRDVIESVAA